MSAVIMIKIKKPSNIKYGDSIGDNSKSYKSSKSDNSDESNEEDKPEKVSSSWIVIACVFGALIGCIIGAVSLTKGGGDDIIVEDTAAVDTISDEELESQLFVYGYHVSAESFFARFDIYRQALSGFAGQSLQLPNLSGVQKP